MSNVFLLVIGCGFLALLYGVYAIRSVLAAPAGTDRMQEIAGAIQEGANAYLNRQYKAIAVAGLVIGVLLGLALGLALVLGLGLGPCLGLGCCLCLGPCLGLGHLLFPGRAP